MNSIKISVWFVLTAYDDINNQNNKLEEKGHSICVHWLVGVTGGPSEQASCCVRLSLRALKNQRPDRQ